MEFSLNNFIEVLSTCNSLKELKNALSVFACNYNVGKIVSIYKKEREVIYDNENAEEFMAISKSDDAFKVEIYPIKGKEINVNNIKTPLNVVFNFLKTSYLEDDLSRAPYIQFNTGLYNSFGLIKEIREKRNFNDLIDNFSVIGLDVRGFSLINKFHTVQFGNSMIGIIGERLVSLLHHDELICHRGSDTFLLVVKNSHIEEILKLINPLTVNVDEGEAKLENLFTINFTIGIVKISSSYDDIAEPLTDAISAILYCKTHGLSIVNFSEDIRENLNNAKTIALTFDEEIKNENFKVFYQPKVDIRTGKIVGAEALARWIKDGKVIPPSFFIPTLEKDGDILKLDLYVLEHACHDISHYRKLGHDTVPLSCNISKKDLLVPGFYRKISEIIEKYDLNYNDIVIEVTETNDYVEKERLDEFIAYLGAHNIKVSIDDFGTKYSSLSLVRDFKIDEIKIDKSFMDSVTQREKDRLILKTIIGLADSLKMEIIAEGVESIEQIEILKEHGCFRAQGYFFDPPLPKLEFEARLSIGKYEIKK